ncbi:MAG: PDZ domain-containing protein [Candidatus Cloacimonetes bacterium]|nr:PDZ domain-containing protein [Candidatus Cloacimonadota bacterium]
MKRTLLSVLILMLFSLQLAAKPKVSVGVVLAENVGEEYGVVIKKVIANSPAEKSGLKPNDILLTIDGEKIYTVDQITKMLSFFEPEQKLKLTYKRADKKESCVLILAERKHPEIPKRTYMGVFLEDLDSENNEKHKIDRSFGVLIREVVKDSPAEMAGLKANDVIISFAKEKLYTSDQLITMLKNYQPGDEVKLGIYRDNKDKTVKLTLGETEDRVSALLFKKDKGIDFWSNPENVLFYKYDQTRNDKWIGILITRKIEKKIIDDKEEKVETKVISEVIPESPAAKAGLKSGDIITAVEGSPYLSIQDALRGKAVGDLLSLIIERDTKQKNINVKIGKREVSDDSKNINVTIENGEIKILIDGIKKTISELENMDDEFERIKVIKKIKQEDLDDVKEKLKDIDLELEIIKGDKVL